MNVETEKKSKNITKTEICTWFTVLAREYSLNGQYTMIQTLLPDFKSVTQLSESHVLT